VRYYIVQATLCKQDKLRKCRMNNKYGLSKEGAQLISEAFDVVEKESGNYKGTQAIKISRGPVYKVRDGLNLITANADEQFVPVNTGDDVTWVDFVADKILDACNIVTDSDEFLEVAESKQKFPLKKHRKMCEKLHLCPKMLDRNKAEL